MGVKYGLNICFTFLLLFTGMHLCVIFGSWMWPWKVETNIDYIQITFWLETAPQDSQNIKKEVFNNNVIWQTGTIFRGRIFCEIAPEAQAGFKPIFSEFTLHLKQPFFGPFQKNSRMRKLKTQAKNSRFWQIFNFCLFKPPKNWLKNSRNRSKILNLLMQM